MLLDDGTRVDASVVRQRLRRGILRGDGLRALARVDDDRDAARRRASIRRSASARRIARPSKIVCIGLNFRDHAAESNMDAAGASRSSSSRRRPRSSGRTIRSSSRAAARKLDWEVELAVVIGATRVVRRRRRSALEHVAGYALHNDYSERAFQLERGGQWVKGKSADTFAPIGPFLATRDEIPIRRRSACG